MSAKCEIYTIFNKNVYIFENVKTKLNICASIMNFP